MNRFAAGILILVATACSPEHKNGSAPVSADINIVDLDGLPIAGVMAIAVREPNAFTEPLAKGTITGNDGRSRLEIPPAARLFVRGWDPELRFFTNNFLEIPAERGSEWPPMQLVMAPGCALDVTLQTSDGAPVAGAPVDMLLSHPTHGPWWPDRAVTKPDGTLHFRSIPAGKFNIELRTERGVAQLNGVVLQPESRTRLGTVILQPRHIS